MKDEIGETFNTYCPKGKASDIHILQNHIELGFLMGDLNAFIVKHVKA